MARLIQVSPHVVFSADVLAVTWCEAVTGVPLQLTDAKLDTTKTDCVDVQLDLL